MFLWDHIQWVRHGDNHYGTFMGKVQGQDVSVRIEYNEQRQTLKGVTGVELRLDLRFARTEATIFVRNPKTEWAKKVILSEIEELLKPLLRLSK